MIPYDYHLHTDFSQDSEEPMARVIQKAISLGLKEIALTDHWDYVYPDGYFPYQIDYNAYADLFLRLKAQYRKEINLIFGVEIGFGPHLGAAAAAFVKKYDFDFVIGSVHDIKGQDLYFGRYFDGLTKEAAYAGYFQYVLDSVKNVRDFCVAGHLDYISRYGDYPDPSVRYADYADLIDAILTALIQNGKGIEVNTSGYRYGIDSVYPQTAILKRYKALGGTIVTVGSDAHRAGDIAASFDQARAALKVAGFDHICVFRKRKPETVRI